MIKKCSICKVEKEIDNFFLHSKSHDGIQSHCKACHYIMAKKCRNKNIEKYRERERRCGKRYRLKNAQRYREKARKSYYLHRDRRLSERRKLNLGFKLNIIEKYGGKCSCCGESDYRFLCIDHKNNDGYEHRKKVRGGENMYRFILKNNYPENFQILCFNCNFGRAFYGGKEKTCPHKIARKTQD